MILEHLTVFYVKQHLRLYVNFSVISVKFAVLLHTEEFFTHS